MWTLLKSCYTAPKTKAKDEGQEENDFPPNEVSRYRSNGSWIGNGFTLAHAGWQASSVGRRSSCCIVRKKRKSLAL